MVEDIAEARIDMGRGQSELRDVPRKPCCPEIGRDGTVQPLSVLTFWPSGVIGE